MSASMSTFGVPTPFGLLATVPSPACRSFLDVRRAASLPARSERVVILLIAMAVFNLADLYMTLLFSTSVGMIESNPLARLVMEYNCPNLLTAWKLGSLTLTLVILYWARKTRVAEFAAWLALVVLVWLTIQWDLYSAEMHTLTPGLVTMAELHADKWVALTPR
ncbi:MAG: DUF5658 family protein [Planctomycetota bacterium]|nr:DUF5658 family protein [Planctomycetota bacterium]